MVASEFASWDRREFANPVWRGKLFIQAQLQLTNGRAVPLVDVDLFTLVGCGNAPASVSHCIPQEMMRIVAAPAPVPPGEQASAVKIEVYARDEVNLNYYNSKLVNVWKLSVRTADGRQIPSTALKVTFTKRESRATFQNRSNIGHIQAHDNSNFSIRAMPDGTPACDGLLFPFAESGD